MQALCESSQWCIPANRFFCFFFAPPLCPHHKKFKNFLPGARAAPYLAAFCRGV